MLDERLHHSAVEDVCNVKSANIGFVAVDHAYVMAGGTQLLRRVSDLRTVATAVVSGRAVVDQENTHWRGSMARRPFSPSHPPMARRRNAIVSLAVGDRCYRPWSTYLRQGWESWCERHDCDLVIYDQPLDTSQRAESRSPAWQKLLAMSSADLSGFDRVIWLDADIWIHPQAGNPIPQLCPDQVAMALDCGAPLSSEPPWFRQAWSQILCTSLNLPSADEAEPRQMFSYYQLWGFPATRWPLWNTGVVVFTPSLHSVLFREIYDRWLDGGPGALYEMIPLNLVLKAKNIIQTMDDSFNWLYGVHHAVWMSQPKHFQAWYGLGDGFFSEDQISRCIADRSQFLHFAGAHQRMIRLLDQSVLS